MSGRGLGWQRDRFDPRDSQHAFSTVLRHKLTAAAPSASVQDRVVKVLDQGGAGTCVPNGGFQAIRIAHVGALLPLVGSLDLAKQKSILGSLLWGYWFARAVIHCTDEDSGCQIRDFFAGISKVGFPPEELWPYSDSTLPGAMMFRFPSKAAFRSAYDQRGGLGYHRIDTFGSERMDDVMQAITNGHAVVAGWDVSQAFCDPANDPGSSLVDVPKPTDVIAGGHCMDIVGYKDSGSEWLILNSWGDFGMGGYFRATPGWIETGEDLWVVESSPLFSEEP